MPADRLRSTVYERGFGGCERMRGSPAWRFSDPLRFERMAILTGLDGPWRMAARPETVRRPRGSLAGCALLMLLGGCVHQRAVAPEAKSAATPSSATPASAPPTTPPSANAPAVESPPQSAAPAASDAAHSSTVPPNDAASMPAAPSKPSAAAPTPSRQGSPPAAAVSSGKPGAPMPVAKSVPLASPKVSPAAREAGSVGPAQPATEATPLAQTAQAAAALDLASLEQRLRDTHAIGVFTKLSLKNQVDDLLAQFKSFHHGQTPPTRTQLRQKFELLLIKVVTVLQDGDAALAAAVSSSREALWSVLSDPQKFAQI